MVIRREVQDEIRARKGIDIPMTRVIMTSDDRNETWWDEVRSYGWARMDHTEQQTVEHYGRWYVIQSLPYLAAKHILLIFIMKGTLSSWIPLSNLMASASSEPTAQRSQSYLNAESKIGTTARREW